MNTAPQSYIWETEIDRVLNTNGRYRFSVLVPNTWSSDQTQSYLESLGWNVVSIGAPPSDVLQAISGILQETGLPSGSAPSAFWVIATWPNATANLPVSSGQLYYATLDYYAPVDANEVAAVNAETQAPPTNWMPAVLAFAGGAILVGTVLYASKSSGSTGHLLHNPVKPDPKMMSAAAINKELDSIDKKRSALNTKFIDAGRGYETPTETHKLSDPLALEYRALADRRFNLSTEVRLRAGPGMYRLPRGFGPRKYAMENPRKRATPTSLGNARDWWRSEYERIICINCGCKGDLHRGVDGKCPVTESWGRPMRFPNLEGSNVEADLAAYWNTSTFYKPRT